MIIKISNLSEGVHSFSFDEKASDIDLGDPFFGNFKLDVEIKKFHNQIILDADIKLNVNFDCDRCNVNFNQVLNTQYQMVYLLGKEPVETESINITYLPLEADKINLKDDLRDFSLLAVPMKKLCMEECKGLCIKCGKELNKGECGCSRDEIDARWLPLMELKNKLNTN